MFSRDEAVVLASQMSDLFGSDPTDQAFQAAVVLLLGIGRRKHLDDLVRVCKYPKPIVKTFAANLRRAQVWRSEKKPTYATWDDDYRLGFLLDVMTACGAIMRQP